MDKEFVLLSEKSWHEDLFTDLQKQIHTNWTWIRNKNDFTADTLKVLNPKYIFIPHWSYIIPPQIYENYTCIVFHMTDLPYGRGGSPLQNLIVRGHKDTKISAIRVSKGIDTGPVYLKKSLSLNGTAEEIFIRSASVIYGMIIEIVEKQIEPNPQAGDPVIFERRKPEYGNISLCGNIEQVYDFIRMLDCEGYPQAYLETDKFRLEFNKANLKSGKTVIANVRITKK